MPNKFGYHMHSIPMTLDQYFLLNSIQCCVCSHSWLTNESINIMARDHVSINCLSDFVLIKGENYNSRTNQENSQPN